MTSPGTSDPRFPTGPFTFDPNVTPATRTTAIAAIRETPTRLRAAVTGLTPDQIETPYRDGGWTVRQVVHHVPESHMNAFVRFKLALTEENPTIKPYEEDRWVQLPDIARVPIETSLTLLDALHQRWIAVLESMDAAQFERALVHPEHGRVTIDWMLQL